MDTLDLGCGNRPEHWIPNSDGLDMGDFGQRYILNLEDIRQWPIKDNSYDRVVANHILEHIRNPDAFINILNEIHRITKHGGTFEGAAPHWTSPNYTRDPTHCRMISEFTFDGFLLNSSIHFNDYNISCTFMRRNIIVNSNKDVVWDLAIWKPND